MRKQHSRALDEAIASVETPAFICDHAQLEANARQIRSVADPLGCKVLYSVKALALESALNVIAASVDGFSASSANEAQLARGVLRCGGTVHFTAPGVRIADVPAIVAACDYVAGNSWHQHELFRASAGVDGPSVGLRVNVGLDFVRDARYAPARRHSKLGIPLTEIACGIGAGDERWREVAGLHLHHNCESRNWGELAMVIDRVADRLGPLLSQARWVNLGGGYFFSRATGLQPLATAVNRLRAEFGVTIFMEPGAAMVENAGILVASVLDLFDSDGVTVAVLDTTINHHPNVFSYQYSPRVLKTSAKGAHTYLLAGCSCLAGDLFGTYRFTETLRIGSRVAFPDAGAYSFVKANMFNGIALPRLYELHLDGAVIPMRAPSFQDYASIYSGMEPVPEDRRSSRA